MAEPERSELQIIIENLQAKAWREHYEKWKREQEDDEDADDG